MRFLLFLTLALTTFSVPAATHKPKPQARPRSKTATKSSARSKSTGKTRKPKHVSTKGPQAASASTAPSLHATPDLGPLTGPGGSTGSGVPEQLAQGDSALSLTSALAPFYAALQQRADEPGNTVRVLQFGDSHTAADLFTGQLRARFQARFGDGGIGFSYPGHPFAGFRIFGSAHGQSSGWTTLGTHFTDLGDTLLGLGGIALLTSHPNDSISLDAPCITLDVHYLQQPGGGSLAFADNGDALSTLATDGTNGPGTFHYDCPPGSHHFTLTTLDAAPVRLLGTTSLQPGITWESLGINGAEAPLILRWSPTLFDPYLTAALPQLIVLAYGTNEAAARLTADTYREVFARLIDTLHRDAPAAAILVLGPGDRSLGSSSATGKGRRRITRRSWTPFAGTTRILEAQRDVCATHNCAFWDWRARQGGLGSMNRWVAAGYAQPDHTHLTGTGYRALADALAADLLSGYDAWQKRIEPSTQ